MYHLNPDIKKGSWSDEEDKTIIEMHKILGTQWAKIAKLLPGRSDGNVKNRFYALERVRMKNVNSPSPSEKNTARSCFNSFEYDSALPSDALSQLAAAAMMMPSLSSKSEIEIKEKKNSRKSFNEDFNKENLTKKKRLSDGSGSMTGNHDDYHFASLSVPPLNLHGTSSHLHSLQLPEIKNQTNNNLFLSQPNWFPSAYSSRLSSGPILPPLHSIPITSKFLSDMKPLGQSALRYSFDQIAKQANVTSDITSQLVRFPPSSSSLVFPPVFDNSKLGLASGRSIV